LGQYQVRCTFCPVRPGAAARPEGTFSSEERIKFFLAQGDIPELGLAVYALVLWRIRQVDV
jgi:hypothetical protein